MARQTLTAIYHALDEYFGPQHWWPGETPLEVAVGAILTQNTNWTNVEKAIRNLQAAGVLTSVGLRDLSTERLAGLIRPSGYFNVKAARLKHFVSFLWEKYDGDLANMARRPLNVLRPKILAVKGIGPETADSILLYALNKPVFVVDAYTRRMLYRHRLIESASGYQDIQRLFQDELFADVALFNQYHALLVSLGKNYCRPHPLCGACPLREIHYDLDQRCRRCYRFLPRLSQRRRTIQPAHPRQRETLPPLLCRDCVSG